MRFTDGPYKGWNAAEIAERERQRAEDRERREKAYVARVIANVEFELRWLRG